MASEARLAPQAAWPQHPRTSSSSGCSCARLPAIRLAPPKLPGHCSSGASTPTNKLARPHRQTHAVFPSSRPHPSTGKKFIGRIRASCAQQRRQRVFVELPLRHLVVLGAQVIEKGAARSPRQRGVVRDLGLGGCTWGLRAGLYARRRRCLDPAGRALCVPPAVLKAPCSNASTPFILFDTAWCCVSFRAAEFAGGVLGGPGLELLCSVRSALGWYTGGQLRRVIHPVIGHLRYMLETIRA
jgi:hypothetical protein